MKVWRTAAVVFVAVVVAATAAGGIVGSMTADEPATPQTAPEHTTIDNPQYTADRVSEDPTPGQATVQMNSAEQNKTVVIHAGGSMSERDIQPLVNVLVANGHTVEVETSAPSLPPIGPIPFSTQVGVPPQPGPGQGQGAPNLDQLLQDAHGFISLGVDSYSEDNLEAIDEFIDDEGRVVMGVNPSQAFAFGSGNSETFSNLGMFTEPGYAYNLAENDLNYQRIYAEPAGDKLLTEDVDRVMLATATPVGAAEFDESLTPIDGTQLSTTRAATDKPLLVRSGDVALVGDTRFMTPENVQRVDNDVFVGNIADFLVTGDRLIEEDVSGGDGETVTVTVAPDGEPRFEPQVVEIDPGDTVEFVWDTGGHNLVPITQPEGSDWEGVAKRKDEGFTHTHTFEVEGAYEIISEPGADQNMVMGVIVGDPTPQTFQQTAPYLGSGL